MSKDKPWFVFYGTFSTVVWAPTRQHAYDYLVSVLFPRREDGGRTTPPTPSEVTIRPPRAADEGWVKQSGHPEFRRALSAAVPTASQETK